MNGNQGVGSVESIIKTTENFDYDNRNHIFRSFDYKQSSLKIGKFGYDSSQSKSEIKINQ